MKTIDLYKYERDGGGITVSTIEPDKPYTTMYRLVADKGKMLTDGKAVTPCIDTETPYLWDEIDDPDTEEKEIL